MPKATPAELAAWQRLARAHAFVRRRVEIALYDDCRLPVAWFDVLDALRSARGGSLRAQDLADAVMITSSTLSRQLDRLEARGWVERTRGGADGRAVAVSLTTEGKVVHKRAASVVARVLGEVFAGPLDGEAVAGIDATAARLLGE